MKINKNKQNKKLLIITLSVVGALLVSGSVYAFVFTQKDASKPVTSNEAQKSEGTTDNPEVKDDTEKTSVPPNTDHPTPPTTDETTGKTTLQMISSHDISSNTLYIRGGINNASVENGTCSAVLNGPNNQTISKETELLQSASTTDCKTIQINLSELTKGLWKYKLVYSSETASGESNEGQFEVR